MVYTYGVGNGFEFTVPADTTLRTLRLYVGVWRVRGRLEAELSDGSSSPYVDSSLSTVYPAGSINGVYTLNYQSASAGQTLTIRWFVDTSTYPVGHVSLHSATLAGKCSDANTNTDPRRLRHHPTPSPTPTPTPQRRLRHQRRPADTSTRCRFAFGEQCITANKC